VNERGKFLERERGILIFETEFLRCGMMFGKKKKDK